MKHGRRWGQLLLLIAMAQFGCVASVAAAEVKLFEFVPWLIRNSGPAQAKGVIYFVRGWGQLRCCRNRDDFQMVPYFLKSLSESGWDVVAAKIPEGPRTERAHEAVEAGVAFVDRRLKELRASGYKRVVLGGHSWGGWLTLVAAQNSEFAADLLLVSSPSTYGPDVIPSGPWKGRKNPDHMRNWSEFQRLVGNVKTPMFMVLMKEDPFEPDAPRAAYAYERLAANNVDYLMINRPPGFRGHSGAWLPVFDLMYGHCIRAFIERVPDRPSCRPGRLNRDSFASYFALDQVPPDKTTRIGSAESLLGKKFAVYTLDDSVREYAYVSKT